MQKIASKSTPSDKIHKKQQDKFVAFLLELANRMGEKFDYVISNPPYQVPYADGTHKTIPIYPDFIEAGRSIAHTSIMIHPARFLSNAGETNKQWNKSVIESPEFSVLEHYHNSSDVFPTVDIKGGVAITMFEQGKLDGGYKDGYISTPLLTDIKKSVWTNNTNKGMSGYVSANSPFRYNDKALTGRTDIRPTAFHNFAHLFSDVKRTGDVSIVGLGEKSQRTSRYVALNIVRDNSLIKAYKVFVPKANGSGALGEIISAPMIGAPMVICTETFLTIGNFDNKTEAEHLLKYIKTKFSRVMLGILKVTQNNPRENWKFVPWQDFTSNSDIDWSKSITEIDKQLYKKYKLTAAQIKFIEASVQEMQ
jgi:hypothetical protein